MTAVENGVRDDSTTAPATNRQGGGVDREKLLKALPWISTPIMLLLLIGSWQFAVSVVGVSEFILPAPLAVWDSLVDLLSTSAVYSDIWITLAEVLIGFAIALVVGMAVGAVLGRVIWLEKAVQPALVALQVVPKVAFIPIFVIWFGFGMTSKIIMAAILAFFPIMLNVMLGVRSVDRGHRDVMRGLGASRWATFKSLELPSTLPYVFAGAEVGIVFAVIGAIVGEYLGGSEGLGHLVVSSLNSLNAPQLFAVIVLLALMGSLLYLAVTTTKRLVIPWHDSVAKQ
ncbi:ABC transporter permease [Modestobacter roseus]|uniref:NitT/TauT family transport system permease protein n=1 Tax=Modestobacter roseus TaxID=1181884 RepID=A0A562IUJ3_9ACTN|nr:ABC transporter permease [Modestobacter roseus]MQA32860.1 ABC transporter permease subunit [Modestobacter roseus]TWH74691.1 NitT/TauT family transport system permease protein [Modestobacter roseus]